ncbi:unnamed protein product [Ectocarpus sp. 6 AP-2014]
METGENDPSDDNGRWKQTPQQEQGCKTRSRQEDDDGLDSLFAMMAVGEAPEPDVAVSTKTQVPMSADEDATKSRKRMASALGNVPLGTTTNLTASKQTGGDAMLTQGKDGADRVRVDRAGRSLDDRKRMDDYIHQRLGFFRPLLLQEDFVEKLRFELQLRLRAIPDDSVLSSAKVRLCGSWAAKLATRASDVNFTVLLQPSSFFDMTDAKKQEAQLKVDHPELRPILTEIHVLHNRWQARCDDIGRLEKARDEAARDVKRDGVKFKFPEKWSLSGVQLEEFKEAASVRSGRLVDVTRDLSAATTRKLKACKAIAAWEDNVPSDKEHLVDRHDKLTNAIANLSYKYQKDVGELTYRVAQEAKTCGFEILEVEREGPTPFAMLTHPHLRTIDNKPVPVRIDINNHHAVFTSRFIRTYVDMDPRVEYFLRFIRLWGGCRGVCSQQGALGFYSHTVLALHYLAAAGYVPSILPDHGKTSTPDQAYGRLGSRKLHAYNRPSKGTFVDGVDYHFFKHVDAANMPAEVDLAMKKNVLERNVRKKLDPRSNKQEACEEEEEEDEEEEGEEAEQEQEDKEEGEEVEEHGDGEEEVIGWDSDVVVIGSEVLDSPQLGVSSSFGIRSAEIGQKDVSDRRSPAAKGTGGVMAAVKTRPEEGSTGIQDEEAKYHNGDTFESGSTNRRSSAAEDGDCHGDASSLPPASSTRCRQVLGWSDLLIVDIILGYFRYYAHKRRGYVGRTFNHHSQVASLRPAMVLPKAVWKGQTPGWRTSVEDAFKTYDGRCALDLGNELDIDSQSRLQNEWNRGVACVERGLEVDVCNLLQPTDADDLDRTAYNLNIEHPRNGVYGTPSFKRIRSKECSPAHTRASSLFKHKKAGRRNLASKKRMSSRHSRGQFRAQPSPISLSGIIPKRRGVPQCGQQKDKRSTTQEFLGKS